MHDLNSLFCFNATLSTDILAIYSMEYSDNALLLTEYSQVTPCHTSTLVHAAYSLKNNKQKLTWNAEKPGSAASRRCSPITAVSLTDDRSTFAACA